MRPALVHVPWALIVLVLCSVIPAIASSAYNMREMVQHMDAILGQRMPFDFTAPLVPVPSGLEDHYCYNPSIVSVGGQSYAYLRCHIKSYFNPRFRRYHGASWQLITGGHNRFILARIPAQVSEVRYSLLDWHEVEVPLEMLPGPHEGNRLSGLQDARLFSYRGRVWFTATGQTWYGHPGPVRDHGPLMGYLSEDLTRVEDSWAVQGFPRGARNILPIVLDDHPFVLDVLEGVLCRMQWVVEEGTGQARLSRAVPVVEFPALQGARMRGGTNPILLEEGPVVGMLVHTIYSDGADPKLGFGMFKIFEEYVHFWLELNLITGHVSLSRPFTLKGSGIEFASSLQALGGERALVLAGIEDQEGWLIGVNITELRQLPKVIDTAAGGLSQVIGERERKVDPEEGRGLQLSEPDEVGAGAEVGAIAPLGDHPHPHHDVVVGSQGTDGGFVSGSASTGGEWGPDGGGQEGDVQADARATAATARHQEAVFSSEF